MSAAAEAVPNGTSLPPALAAIKPVQLSFPLPRTSNTRINIHLTIQSTALVLFVTTTSPEHDAGATAPMGSFVYAMPQNTSHTPSNSSATSPPISTPLYAQTPTLDLATRLARILARKSGRPTYVGNSTSFASAGLGGSVEEEMEGLARVVEVVTGELARVEQVEREADAAVAAS
ncbi:hypothetical protein HDK77DRAFT_482014 [Phyllosticta capitalensis]|uniref:Uncharacterized protein n=1 Tax=Phyllosticta capitalensis TaxID=121624 RepID=A0ABR1YNE2_9PEZI